jgi:two-component system sensor histidine kinase VanS
MVALLYTGAMLVLFCLARHIIGSIDHFRLPETSPGILGGGTLRRKNFAVPVDVSAAIFAVIWIVGLLLIVWRLPKKASHGDGLHEARRFEGEKIQKSIRRRYGSQFALSLGIHTAVLLLIAALFFFIKNSRVWYADEPLYPILFLGKLSFPWAMAFLWLGGAAVLLFRAWRQNAADISGLLGSIEQMLADADTIDVPENLREVRPVLTEIQNENRRNKQSAREAAQRKSELIVYLAHDLKTPLTSVIGYLNLLNEVPDMPREQRAKYTHIALDKALRLESLTAQFFEISRFNLHDPVLEASRFDLRYLLTQMADEFYPLLNPQGKTIRIDAPDEIWLTGDAEKLARVFNNLLRNAVSYSGAGSEIAVRAWRDGDNTSVQVANPGKTVPAHKLESIFEQFYRLDEARASDTGGSGLGLAIAKEIVLKHGGAITAQSENGLTAFTVVLPSAPANSPS